jgi:hypothetical protein
VSVDLPDGTAIHTWSEPATGWPTLCLRAVRASWEREYTRGAIVLARGRQHLGVRDFLPHYPIWRGLIANTLFFAVPWYLLLISVPFVRRRWRLCRGQCPSCRYDLRGDLAAGCPECGWGRG